MNQHRSRRAIISGRRYEGSRSVPGVREVKVIEREDPRISQPDQVMLRMLDVGICGTDKEICTFEYGTPRRVMTTW
jgi:threonine dehydrogenase-like Zn-dependent dehydrogenase